MLIYTQDSFWKKATVWCHPPSSVQYRRPSPLALQTDQRTEWAVPWFLPYTQDIKHHQTYKISTLKLWMRSDILIYMTRLYPSSFMRSTFWWVMRLLRSHSKHLEHREHAMIYNIYKTYVFIYKCKSYKTKWLTSS